jgi:hypothetical protein
MAWCTGWEEWPVKRQGAASRAAVPFSGASRHFPFELLDVLLVPSQVATCSKPGEVPRRTSGTGTPMPGPLP